MVIFKWGETFYDEIMSKGKLVINEDDILEAFIKSNTLKGRFYKKVRIGKTDLYCDATGRMSQRSGRIIIDAICKENDVVRIIEVEKQLTYTAIGQAIVYAHLYGKENPNSTPIPTIVCFLADEDFLEACEKYAIDVYFCGYGYIPGW